MNKKRTIEKWCILWPVDFSRDNDKIYWVFFGNILKIKNMNYGMIGKKVLVTIGKQTGGVKNNININKKITLNCVIFCF